MNRRVLGETVAYSRSDFFGYPDWISVYEAFLTPYGLAFNVRGDVVPENSSILVLQTSCLLFTMRTRRKSESVDRRNTPDSKS